jgi:hypothetical protein
MWGRAFAIGKFHVKRRGPGDYMKELQVGLRIHPVDGLSFFGLDDVNNLLQDGATIRSLEPGGTLMGKVDEDAENVRLRFTGFYLKVLVDNASEA